MNPAARPACGLPASLKTGAGLAAFAAMLLIAGLVASRWAGTLAAFYVFGAALIAVPLLLLAAVALTIGALEYSRDRRHLGSERESAPTSFGNTP